MSSLLLGTAISILAFWRTDASCNKKYGAILLPLLLSCWAIPYPYNAGLIVCAAGFSIALVAPGLRMIWLGTIFSGTILILDSLTLSIYYILAPNYHFAGWLTSGIAYILDLTGLEAAANAGMVFILAQEKVFPFTVTLEKLGFYPWILIYVGSLLILFLISQSISSFLKHAFIALIAGIFYLLLRYVVLVHIFFFRDLPEFARVRMDIFTDPWWLIVSFAPLVLLFLRFKIPDDLMLDFHICVDRKQAVALAAVVVSVFCLTSSALFLDTGIKKDGRVLVDEIHSIWEFSTLKLDRNWYGENSTYNAYSMIEWLNNSYHVDRIVSPTFRDWNVSGAQKVVPDIISDSITYDILKNYDILIIKTPSTYQPAEIDAVVRFVENGGGLFLIGDHTNFAGIGTNLNQISRKFGIEFGFDAVNTINGTLFYFQRGEFLHPVIKYMPNLDFMTGCSLITPLGGEPVIMGSGLRADPGEFASVGFFRETRENDPTQVTDTVWGLINQAVAVKYGRGRIVAFADSTIISNFRIFFGGSSNFVIGAMEYLNRKNSYENEKQILFLLGLMFACLAAYLLGRMGWGDRKMAALLVVLAIGALTAGGALLIFSTKGESTIPSRFYVHNHTVGFDGEHSDVITSQGDVRGQYETFYIWTQRVNLTPAIENRMDDAMTKGRALVVIDPVVPISREGLTSLQNYIKGGNYVLLMVSSEGPWSEVIKYFGMQTYYMDEPNNAANASLKNTAWSWKDGLPIKPWGLAIKGGRPLYAIDGRVVLAETNYGKGKFLLFADSQVFKDGLFARPGFMGYPKVDPSMVDKESYDLLALYNLEYRIFEDYLGFGENS
ncbi:MAG: motility-associated ABC transporter substrate-binding family protein [Methanothrix sp.]